MYRRPNFLTRTGNLWMIERPAVGTRCRSGASPPLTELCDVDVGVKSRLAEVVDGDGAGVSDTGDCGDFAKVDCQCRERVG